MPSSSPVNPELVFSLRRVTERAATAAFSWIGRGDSQDAGSAEHAEVVQGAPGARDVLDEAAAAADEQIGAGDRAEHAHSGAGHGVDIVGAPRGDRIGREHGDLRPGQARAQGREDGGQDRLVPRVAEAVVELASFDRLAGRYGGGTGFFEGLAALAGWVPLIAVVSGPSFAGHATLAAFCDAIITTRGSAIGMGWNACAVSGPPGCR